MAEARSIIPLDEIGERWRSAVSRGLDAEPAAIFHDLDRLARRADLLEATFPPGTLHAIAIKANPVIEILRVLVARGFGLEAASWEEVALARAAGCVPSRIVFDSPAKSTADLARALEAGVLINADNFDELARIEAIGAPAGTIVGLRINPQVGSGSIAGTSVADARSRFGVPIRATHDIVAAFRRHPWLRGLHCHVGSQGCTLEQLVVGAARIERLLVQIEDAIGEPLRRVDIGGGLPAIYRREDRPPSIDAYADALRAQTPRLWSRPLVTELGRWLHAGAGYAISRVEYVKSIEGDRVAVLHFGADFLLRPVYRPEDWHHDLDALDGEGRPLDTPLERTTVAGPLCFAGDVIARGRLLPRLSPRDLVVVRDCGAYTLSMWSRYCSRAMPVVLGVKGGEVEVLRRRETPEDLVAFWSR